MWPLAASCELERLGRCCWLGRGDWRRVGSLNDSDLVSDLGVRLTRILPLAASWERE
jgi:hypothetical protein